MTMLSMSAGQPHHQALEIDAMRALAARDFATAFRLADRRCRISPPAEAHDYVLRAEALFRMGERRSALTDLGRAIAIAPDNMIANRRMLSWGSGRRRKLAALSLIGHDSDTRVLSEAIDAVGRRRPLGALRAFDDRVHGWAAWDGHAPVEVIVSDVEGETVSSFVDADATHPLTGATTQAASFDLPRPRSPAAQSIHLAIDGTRFVSIYAPPNQRGSQARLPDGAAGERDGVTVIVPVYRDFEATRTCIEALRPEIRRTPQHRALIVNDATPEPRIARYLDEIAGEPGVTVMTNSSNRGFVGAVNRALDEIAGGDVILLNADTVPPPGFIDRLAAAAHSDAGIGTVVPLSNNGELTNFPRGGESRLGPVDEVLAIDATAARVNAGRVIDIPSGTGFCLYVTRACLTATGALSEAFHFGYFEDIDFGLRARAAGFRAVCAPSVYVGHAGSRSFGSDKSALVLKNFPILAERFPDYPNECAAFAAADPLRPARAAMERESLAWPSGARLLVTADRVVAEIAEERARQVSGDGEASVVLRLSGGPYPAVEVSGSGRAIPQSMRFRLGDVAEMRSIADVIGLIAPSAIEILNPANVPAAFLELLLGSGFPCDLLIADDGLFRPAGAERQRTLATVRERARRFVAPNGRAEAYAARYLLPEETARLARAAPDAASTRMPAKSGALRLGVVPGRSSPDELRVVQAIAVALARASAEATMIVLGETAGAEGLMASGNTFVTGPCDASELARTMRHHGVGHVLAGFGRPLFGHPATERALAANRPVATVDWSGRRVSLSPCDLAIAPGASANEIAAAVCGWMMDERR
jgi:O-antigen biosynthesis protein